MRRLPAAAQVGAIVALVGAMLVAGCRTPPRGTGPAPAVGGCRVAARLVEVATDYYGRRMYPQAVRELMRAEEQCPADPGVINLFGHVALASGRLEEAERRFKQLVEIDPKNTDGRLSLAAVYMENARWREALAELSIVERDILYDYPYLVFRNIAVCHRKLGDNAYARIYLGKAIEQYEHFCLAWYDLGELDMEAQDYERACYDFERALHEDPAPARDCRGFVDAHYKLALCNISRRKPERAAPHLAECVRLSPEGSARRAECAELQRYTSPAAPPGSAPRTP